MRTPGWSTVNLGYNEIYEPVICVYYNRDIVITVKVYVEKKTFGTKNCKNYVCYNHEFAVIVITEFNRIYFWIFLLN